MIQSIDRAAQVLQSLQGARHLGVTEIAERLGLATSTTHGIVKSLAAHGLVAKEPNGSRYMLGPALLRLSSVFLDTHEVRLRSLRWLDALATRTGLAVRLGVELFDDVMVIHHVARPDGTDQMAETGISIPVHACALGKVLLAYDAHAAREVLEHTELRSLTPATVTDPAALLAELAEVRRAGLACEREEAVVGESGLAVPIVDRTGAVVAAAGVVVAASRWPEGEQFAAVVDPLREAARAISRELGAAAWPPG